MIKLSTLIPNPDNPRLIKDAKFEKLKQSIKEFPKMLELRPLIVTKDNIVIGGNMRLKALIELGYKDIPEEWIKHAERLTEDEVRRFIIADNVGFGEHDWDLLANDWDAKELEGWGLEGFPFENEIDEIEEEIKDERSGDTCEKCGKAI
jgi:ParB-like chromosome segregation protein Spo0J